MTRLIFLIVALASTTLVAQALRFDVASVKPSSGSTRFGISRPTNGVEQSRGAELRRLIRAHGQRRL